MKVGIAILLGLLAINASVTSASRLVCYFSSWAVYRQGEGHYVVEDIDPKMCTHIVYAFIALNYEGEVKLMDEYNDVGDEWHEGNFKKFQKLKEQNPSLNLMLAVGGWNHGPGTFQETVKNPAKRQKFIDSSIAMLEKYGFNGLDIDWEYQDAVGGSVDDKLGFSQLLRDMSAAYKQKGFLLSAATSANFNLIEVCYELDVMSQTLDFINLMAYDLHGSWEKVTGHIAPLHGRQGESADEAHLNVEAIVNKYIERGANPQKINLGLPIYGRTFTLADPNNHGIGAPTYGPGPAGNIVPEQGSFAYAEVCEGLKAGQFQEYWDDQQQIPYAVRGDLWVGYDNVKSIDAKMNFAKGKGIGGAMVWSLETDDHNNKCGLGAYSFINDVKKNLP